MQHRTFQCIENENFLPLMTVKLTGKKFLKIQFYIFVIVHLGHVCRYFVSYVECVYNPPSHPSTWNNETNRKQEQMWGFVGILSTVYALRLWIILILILIIVIKHFSKLCYKVLHVSIQQSKEQ